MIILHIIDFLKFDCLFNKNMEKLKKKVYLGSTYFCAPLFMEEYFFI